MLKKIYSLMLFIRIVCLCIHRKVNKIVNSSQKYILTLKPILIKGNFTVKIVLFRAIQTLFYKISHFHQPNQSYINQLTFNKFIKSLSFKIKLDQCSQFTESYIIHRVKGMKKKKDFFLGFHTTKYSLCPLPRYKI